MMIAISDNGDSHLSSFQNKLWSFTYTVLLKFGCPIQFRVDGPDVRHKMNQHITFFVPKGRVDVVEYIIREWQHEVRTEHQAANDEDWFWGTEVSVMFFNGIELYTEKAVIDDMAQNMMLYLTAKLSGKETNVVDFIKPSTKH